MAALGVGLCLGERVGAEGVDVGGGGELGVEGHEALSGGLRLRSKIADAGKG